MRECPLFFCPFSNKSITESTEDYRQPYPVKLDYTKAESDGVFTGVTIQTPFFTLKAPKVRIKDTESRYKIWVLSRIKDD